MGFSSSILGLRSEDVADVEVTSHVLSEDFKKLFQKASPASRAFLKKLQKLEDHRSAHHALIHTAQQTAGIAGQLDLAHLAEFVLDHGLKLVDAERGLLVLRDEDGEYQVTAARHLNLGTLQETSEISRSLLDSVIESGEPLITTNIQDDPRMTRAESVFALSIRSVLAVPLMTQDEVIGAFYLDTQISTRVFDDADLPIIQAFSNITASAIGLVRAVEARDELYLQLVRTLVNAVEAKDPYTAGHSDRVGVYAQEITRALGRSEYDVKNALIAGYLHDIGKIGIDNAYVTKEGPLEPHEWEAFKQHTIIGVRILENVEALKEILPAVRWHHEKLNGTGYPDGISGDAIPFLARVINVADAFDAMTSNRSYRRAMSRQEAVEELVNCSGTQFDPQIVKAMIHVLNSGVIDFQEQS